MPFGLRNAAQTFQTFIDEVLHNLHFFYSYIDDVLIASRDVDEHKNHLRQVFERFRQFGVVINPSKCEFGVSELTFLGHRLTSQGIHPLSDKVQAIQGYPQPNTPCKLQEFLGLVNFYHHFIPHCAHILRPLHNLLTASQDNKQLSFTQDATEAFANIKQSFINVSLLLHPKPDAPTNIMTDASDSAVGTVLQQFINSQWCPIAFFSRKLQTAEARYSTFDHELLAIYLAIKHFRHFVKGRTFHIITDHKPLTFALSSHSDKTDPSP